MNRRTNKTKKTLKFGDNHEEKSDLLVTEEEEKNKIETVKKNIAERHARDKAYNWLLYILALLAIALCCTLGFFFSLPLLIGYGLLGGGLFFAINYIYHSTDRSKTIGRIAGAGITIILVALYIKEIISSGISLFLPLSVIGGVSSFISNIILYVNDIPRAIDNFINADWTLPKNGKEWGLAIANNGIELGILSLSLSSSYLLTTSMVHHLTALLAIHLFGVSLATAPFILVPIIAIVFIGNLAFVHKGLKQIKQHFMNAWNYSPKSYVKVEKYPLLDRLKRMLFYFLDFKGELILGKNGEEDDVKFDKRNETLGTRIGKVIVGLLKLLTFGALAYLSQVPMVQSLVKHLSWAGHHVLFKWILPASNAIGIQAMIARAVVLFDKAATIIPKLLVDGWHWLRDKFSNNSVEDSIPNTPQKNTRKNKFKTRLTFKDRCINHMLDWDTRPTTRLVKHKHGEEKEEIVADPYGWETTFGKEWKLEYYRSAKELWDTHSWYHPKVVAAFFKATWDSLTSFWPALAFIALDSASHGIVAHHAVEHSHDSAHPEQLLDLNPAPPSSLTSYAEIIANSPIGEGVVSGLANFPAPTYSLDEKTGRDDFYYKPYQCFFFCNRICLSF